MRRRVARFLPGALPRVPRQAAEEGGAVGQGRRARHRRDGPAAARSRRAGAARGRRPRRDRRDPGGRARAADRRPADRRRCDLPDRRACALGLGYLSLDRATPSLSPGELQRIRLATQIHSNLFGVVYVLDEPSAGLHPADAEALAGALERLKAAGNSVFVVEHDLDLIGRADWIVDMGPDAGERGGQVLYSGPPDGLAGGRPIAHRPLPVRGAADRTATVARRRRWLTIAAVSRNNLRRSMSAFPSAR